MAAVAVVPSEAAVGAGGNLGTSPFIRYEPFFDVEWHAVRGTMAHAPEKTNATYIAPIMRETSQACLLKKYMRMGIHGVSSTIKGVIRACVYVPGIVLRFIRCHPFNKQHLLKLLINSRA